MFLHSTLFVISFGSLFYVNNQTVCSTVLNLYKDNMMIKEVCLLSWLGKWIPERPSSGRSVPEAVQHFSPADARWTRCTAVKRRRLCIKELFNM